VSGASWLNDMFNGVALIVAVALSIQRTPSGFWGNLKARLRGKSSGTGSDAGVPLEEVSAGAAAASSSHSGSGPH
jgi:hypothetical protein